MTLRYFSGFYGVKMCPVFQPDMISMQSRGLDTVVVPATMSVLMKLYPCGIRLHSPATLRVGADSSHLKRDGQSEATSQSSVLVGGVQSRTLKLSDQDTRRDSNQIMQTRNL